MGMSDPILRSTTNFSNFQADPYNEKKDLSNLKHKWFPIYHSKANSKTADFLDITLDLKTGDYQPFMKENDTPMYVSSRSNHPALVLKNISMGVNRRLSRISANK